MLRQQIFVTLSLAAAGLLSPAVRAAQFLIVTHAPDGAWNVDAVDSVTVNGKDKVRLSAIAATRPPNWDRKSVSRLPNTAIQGLGIISRASDGALWGRNDPSAEWTLLLPDGSDSKASGTAAALWRGATLTVVRDHKEKAGVNVPVDRLYAIVPGMDVQGSAAHLAMEPKWHEPPGVDAPAAFRNMIGLVPPLVKLYPAGPATEKVRDNVRTLMESRIEKWSAGDAPLTVLEEALLVAKSSAAAFPEDGAQKKLRASAEQARQHLDRRLAILRALDRGGLSDQFLVAYRDFEPDDRSFPDLARMRRKHLEASALAHLEEGKRLRAAADYVGAIRHLRLALLRSPQMPEVIRLLEQVRLEVAHLSSQQFAETRRGIDPRSAVHVQVDRRLSLAEQYIHDSKAAEAEKTLEEAESIDQNEPRIKLYEAHLAVLRGELGLALALLDLYAGMATTQEDFAEGEKLRATVHYQIENQRTRKREELKRLFDGQRFATGLQSATESLKIDNEEPAFLYQAGLDACLLRHCPEATPLLRRFLELTDSIAGVREQRIAAVRLLQRATQPAPAPRPVPRSAELSWFSGEPLEAGTFYDPVSLAFQPKVARIAASDHLSVTYQWKGNNLESVHTKYEDKKTGGNVARLALGIGMAAGAGAGAVRWKTAERETNDFYFNYYDDAHQVYNVNRDNQVVKSRTINIMIPGIGGFGAFGALGSLGSMASLGSMRGLAGISGMSGMSSWSGLYATASSLKRPGGLSSAGGGAGASLTAAGDSGPRNYAIHGDPQGGASSGYVTLWNNPRLDTELALSATGKKLAVGFSGNHFFHPFVWNDLHLFELSYDAEGRVEHARELDQPNPPILDFSWEGRRLMSVVARENSPAATVVYTRTLTYAENRLSAEVITAAGKTSHIRYKYDKQGRLVEAECTEDTSLDGRSRKVEFLLEGAEKER